MRTVMSLLEAFKKQAELKLCPICHQSVAVGVYRSHFESCKIPANDDDDCCVIAVINPNDRKQSALPESSLTRIRRRSDKITASVVEKAAAVSDNTDVGEMKSDYEEVCILEPSVADEIPRKRTRKLDSVTKHEQSTERHSAIESHPSRLYKRSDSICCSVSSTDEKSQSHSVEDCSVMMDKFIAYLNTSETTLPRRFVRTKSNSSDCSSDSGDGSSSSYYYYLFHRILRRVFCIDNEKNIYSNAKFWGNHVIILTAFTMLTEAAKKLLIRLITRKRKWLIAEKVMYAEIGNVLNPIFEELVRAQLIDSANKDLDDLSEAVHLLQAPSLKTIAKLFRLESYASKEEARKLIIQFGSQKNVFGMTMAKNVLKSTKKELGACYRLRKNVAQLFDAIFTIYSPVDMNSSSLFDQPSQNLSSQLLFTLLQLSIAKQSFPMRLPTPVIDIYSDFNKLMNYVEAKELEAEIADLASKNSWTPIANQTNSYHQKFKFAFESNREYYSKLPGYLRRFTDAHVYVRCVIHGVGASEKLRKYEEAVKWLEIILLDEGYQLFTRNSRGRCWDRLALNLETHLRKKNKAMEIIIAGVGDQMIGEKHRLLLQDRGEKIRNEWNGPVRIGNFTRVDIEGSVLCKNLGESRINRFMLIRNGITYECNVEEVALEAYISEKGYREGIHGEGRVWHTLFGLIFYDAIFDFGIDNVWLSETQTHPADLNDPGFFERRMDLFELRFNQLEDHSLEVLLSEMQEVYETRFGESNSEMSWNCFSDFDQIKRLMKCCPLSSLSAIFRRIASDYRNNRSGFPDLTLWNDETMALCVVEVKGPGDKLSPNQRLWLNFFTQSNINAHVCHVRARNPRLLD